MRFVHLLSKRPLTTSSSSTIVMICRVQENEGANTVCLKANLKCCSLLHLRLLPHLFSILLLFPSFFLFLFFPPLPPPPLSASFYHSSSPSFSSSHSSFSSSFSPSSFYEIRQGYKIYYIKNQYAYESHF